MLRTNTNEISIPAKHLQAVDHLAALRRIVVKKSYRRKLQLLIVSQLTQQKLTAVTSPVNLYPTSILFTDRGQQLSK